MLKKALEENLAVAGGVEAVDGVEVVGGDERVVGGVEERAVEVEHSIFKSCKLAQVYKLTIHKKVSK